MPLYSCGKFSDTFKRLKDGETTKVVFKLAGKDGLSTSALLPGGIMVWAINDAQTQGSARSLDDEFDHSAMFLKNDAYRFFAVGWDGGTPLTGQAKCALPVSGAPIVLNGGTVTVSLVFNEDNCNFGGDSPFGPAVASASATNFNSVDVFLCLNAYPNSGGCTPATGFTGSARLVLEGFDVLGNGELVYRPEYDLQSNCVNFSGAATLSFATVAFPTGDDASGYPTFPIATVEIYSGTGCSGSLIEEYEYKDGLDHPDYDPGSYYSETEYSSTITQLYLKRTF